MSWEGKTKGIKIGKKEIKTSVFADDMILCMKKHKCFTKKLLELINLSNTVAGYKTQTQNQYFFFNI